MELQKSMDLDGLVLCFSFGMWCCLHTEFYSLISIIESVVLRSWGPKSGVLLQLCVSVYTGAHLSMNVHYVRATALRN